MWALAPLVGSGAAFASGADFWVVLRVLLAGLLPAMVFLFSFVNPQSYWKLTRFDLGCGLFSLLAMVVWLLADSPRAAILLAVAADAIASLPTLSKAWQSPNTETGITYAANFASMLFLLPTISVWNIENSIFQIYLLGFNFIMTYCIYRKRLYRFLE